MKNEKSGTFRRLISPLLMLLVTLSVFTFCTVAWYASLKKVNSGGMTISGETEKITVHSRIAVKRYLKDQLLIEQIYAEDGRTNCYYLFDEAKNDFYLNHKNERVPFSIKDLLPGETVEVALSYSCDEVMEGKPVEICFSGIQSDTIGESGNPSALHSVLGVYKIAVFDGTNFVDKGWMQTYTEGVSDTPITEYVLSDGEIWKKVSDVKEQNYKEFKFRLTVDFSQYTLLKTPTNALSEKSFKVAELKVRAKDA